MQIPVLREGNLIALGNTTLEVADACSGISSLVSLLGGAVVYGYFLETRISVRATLVLASAPTAILANSFRVAGTGVAAHIWGPEAAQGFFHIFSGWLVFAAAFAMLVVFHRVLIWILPAKPAASGAQCQAA
jgi:exosortase